MLWGFCPRLLPVSRRGDARVAPPFPTTSFCVCGDVYLTLPYHGAVHRARADPDGSSASPAPQDFCKATRLSQILLNKLLL